MYWVIVQVFFADPSHHDGHEFCSLLSYSLTNHCVPCHGGCDQRNQKGKACPPSRRKGGNKRQPNVLRSCLGCQCCTQKILSSCAVRRCPILARWVGSGQRRHPGMKQEKELYARLECTGVGLQWLSGLC